MNRGKMFRSRMNRRMHELQDTANHLESTVKEQASALAEQTREGWTKGQKAVGEWEKAVGNSVRANPMLYFGAALAAVTLAGLLAAGMMMKRKR